MAIDLKPGQYIKECQFFETCVACGERYHPKYLKDHNDIKVLINVSDRHCDPRRIKKRRIRERARQKECEGECTELDCKFEYLEEMKNEMA